MRQLISSLTCFGLIALAGCPGTAPVTTGDDAPEVDAGIDGTPEPVGQTVSGKTMDYFTANTPLDTASITSDGIAPPMTATSATGGVYTLDGVPTGSKVYFSVTATNYRPTRNPAVTVEGMPVVQDLHVMTVADVARQYSSVGMPLVAGKAFLAAELFRNNGMPLAGIPLTDITLVDAADVAVPGVLGPYVFGTLGDINDTELVATTYGGKSRVAFLDVPVGSYTLKVIYPDDQNVPKTFSVPVTFVADGATIAKTGGMGGGGGGGAITNPTFAANIYPRLQKASAGGLGCANCHTAGGPAGGVLRFDDLAPLTLENMKARLGVIDLATPANSLLLTKPLYEPAPYNHPNASFVDINDPDYKLLLLWITQGALP